MNSCTAGGREAGLQLLVTVAADDKVYVASADGVAIVLDADGILKILATRLHKTMETAC